MTQNSQNPVGLKRRLQYSDIKIMGRKIVTFTWVKVDTKIRTEYAKFAHGYDDRDRDPTGIVHLLIGYSDRSRYLLCAIAKCYRKGKRAGWLFENNIPNVLHFPSFCMDGHGYYAENLKESTVKRVQEHLVMRHIGAMAAMCRRLTMPDGKEARQWQKLLAEEAKEPMTAEQ